MFFLGIRHNKPLPPLGRHRGPMPPRLVIARPDTHRAYPPEAIAKAFAAHVADPVVVPKAPEAVDRAIVMAGPDGLVVVTGSIYTAGEAFAHLQGPQG